MTDKKKREDFPDGYSWRKELLWRDVISKDDLKSPNIISYFIPSGGTTLIDGRVKQVKEIEYKASMNIKECFSKIEDLMMTKKLTKKKRLTLKAEMLKLAPHEEYMLISLLSYLREEFLDGNRGEVMLSWQEFFTLRDGAFSKKSFKKK